MSHIIVLNGTSSSGKSSISKELQKKLEGEWIHVPLDSFFPMIREDLFDASISNVMSAVLTFIRSLADQGYNIIYDTVFYSPDAQCSLLRKELTMHDITWVKVICSDLNTLSSRESARQNRPIGVAKSEMGIVYNSYQFDLEVDTSLTIPEHTAFEIVKYFSNN